MKNPSSDSPRWLNNHWKVLKDLLHRADFQNELESIRQERATDKFMAPMPFGEVYTTLFTRHSIPLSCMLAIDYLIDHPDASDEQLRSRLTSPVRWTSHHLKEAGPSNDPQDEYRVRMHSGGQPRKDALVLEVMPHTKVSEIKDFLDQNKVDLDRILTNPSTESDWLFPARLSRRVDEPNKLNEAILALHAKGMTSAQIARELNIEDRYDQAHIRKIVSMTKRKRKNVTK